MDYDLAKELKEAGFPQNSVMEWEFDPTTKEAELHEKGLRGCARCGAIVSGLRPHLAVQRADCPTLEELIEACGDEFFSVQRHHQVAGRSDSGIFFRAFGVRPKDGHNISADGPTPKVAAARLWLALNPKQ